MNTETLALALWLADQLDKVPEHGADPDLIERSSAELRRLHVENQQLRADLEAIGAGGVGPLMPATVQPQREPMTDEEITEITFELLKVGASMHEFARAIERAHGIGGDA